MRELKVDTGKIGWKNLRDILRVLIDAIDSNAPRQGHGISLSETDHGIMISLDPKTADEISALNNALQGQWIPVNVVDSNCKPSVIWVWGSFTQPSASSP